MVAGLSRGSENGADAGHSSLGRCYRSRLIQINGAPRAGVREAGTIVAWLARLR
jgi:hypothetical protein